MGFPDASHIQPCSINSFSLRHIPLGCRLAALNRRKKLSSFYLDELLGPQAKGHIQVHNTPIVPLTLHWSPATSHTSHHYHLTLHLDNHDQHKLRAKAHEKRSMKYTDSLLISTCMWPPCSRTKYHVNYSKILIWCLHHICKLLPPGDVGSCKSWDNSGHIWWQSQNGSLSTMTLWSCQVGNQSSPVLNTGNGAMTMQQRWQLRNMHSNSSNESAGMWAQIKHGAKWPQLTYFYIECATPPPPQ